MVENWLVYAFAGFFFYFLVNLLFKFVAKDNPIIIGLVFYITAALLMLVMTLKGEKFSLGTRSIIIAILIGISSSLGFIMALKSIRLAPNPGYSVAIFSANFVLLSIVSVFVFKSSLTIQKGIGILAVLAGLVLLSL